MSISPTVQETASATDRRLRALAQLQLLDTVPEPEFDDLVELAADLCGMPVGLLSLMDDHRQFHKAHFGTEVTELPLSMALCKYTVLTQQPVIVPDMSLDTRFQENPLVCGPPGLRFYAGIPLHVEEGVTVGALCVADTVPRPFSAAQERTLRIMADQISARFQSRLRVFQMEALAEELQAERELFKVFLDSMPVEAYLKSSAGELLFYNRRVADRFEVSPSEWIGKTSRDLWSAEQAEAIQREDNHVLRSGRTQENYAELPGPDGNLHYWKVLKTPIKRPDGETLLANVAIDLTDELRREAALQRAQDELEEANRKLRSLSLTDELTGLWNRRAFDARLELEVFRAGHQQSALTLLMIDVDDFKKLNDSYGHAHGDAVLKQVSEVLRKAVRAEDMAARYGGEEFAIILPETPVLGAQKVCARISDVLKTTHWRHRSVTVSIGISCWGEGNSTDELLNMADEAMYQAKRNGKSCAVAYEARSQTTA